MIEHSHSGAQRLGRSRARLDANQGKKLLGWQRDLALLHAEEITNSLQVVRRGSAAAVQILGELPPVDLQFAAHLCDRSIMAAQMVQV